MQKILVTAVLASVLVSPAVAKDNHQALSGRAQNNCAEMLSQKFSPIPDADREMEISFSPVTRAQYLRFQMAKNKYIDRDMLLRADLPVTDVSYYDAVRYCIWLNGKDRAYNYRLPTEKEWELAAEPAVRDRRMPLVMGAVEDMWELTSSFAELDAVRIRNKTLKDSRLVLGRGVMDAEGTSHDVGFRIVREKRRTAR